MSVNITHILNPQEVLMSSCGSYISLYVWNVVHTLTGVRSKQWPNGPKVLNASEILAELFRLFFGRLQVNQTILEYKDWPLTIRAALCRGRGGETGTGEAFVIAVRGCWKWSRRWLRLVMWRRLGLGDGDRRRRRLQCLVQIDICKSKQYNLYNLPLCHNVCQQVGWTYNHTFEIHITSWFQRNELTWNDRLQIQW